MAGKKRPPDPAEKQAKKPRQPEVRWVGPEPVSGPYPQSIGKGAGAGGKAHPNIAEDMQGYSSFGVRPRVRRKPQEAHTPSAPPEGRRRSLMGIAPSTNALIRSSKKKKP